MGASAPICGDFMTLERVREQARRFARITSSSASDTQVNNLINDAVGQFAIDVGGFPKEERLAISAKFTTETYYAIHVKIVDSGATVMDTDIAITATAREDATGTTVASDLQTALRAATGAVGTETVTWTNFYFTIDYKQGNTASGDYIEVSGPTTVTYADALELLGIGGTTTGSTSVQGSFPQDCTITATLSSNLLSMNRVLWDNWQLFELPGEYAMAPRSSGTPRWYYVRGKDIYLIPSPSSQNICRVWYKAKPADIVFSGYQGCGLSGLSNKSATGLTASTQYYFKVAIDGGAVTEYDITTVTDVTYSAIITLMNAAVSGATFAIVDGDLRCTSDQVTGNTSIALSAGTTGTDLFGTLTGFSAFATAVAGDTDLPSEMEEAYQRAIPHLTAYYLLMEQFDMDRPAQTNYAEYMKIKNQYTVDYSNRQTRVDDISPNKFYQIPKVIM